MTQEDGKAKEDGKVQGLGDTFFFSLARVVPGLLVEADLG